MTARPPSFVVRPATPADLPAIARLAAGLVRQHHAFDPARFAIFHEPIEPGYADWLGHELRNRKAVVLAAVRTTARGLERGVIGYAYGRFEPRDWNQLRERCGCVHDLWVADDARRHGVASALMAAIAERLAALGAPQIVVHTAWKNRAAQAFFRRLGLRPVMVEMSTAPPKPRPKRP